MSHLPAPGFTRLKAPGFKSSIQALQPAASSGAGNSVLTGAAAERVSNPGNVNSKLLQKYDRMKSANQNIAHGPGPYDRAMSHSNQIQCVGKKSPSGMLRMPEKRSAYMQKPRAKIPIPNLHAIKGKIIAKEKSECGQFVIPKPIQEDSSLKASFECAEKSKALDIRKKTIGSPISTCKYRHQEKSVRPKSCLLSEPKTEQLQQKFGYKKSISKSLQNVSNQGDNYMNNIFKLNSHNQNTFSNRSHSPHDMDNMLLENFPHKKLVSPEEYSTQELAGKCLKGTQKSKFGFKMSNVNYYSASQLIISTPHKKENESITKFNEIITSSISPIIDNSEKNVTMISVDENSDNLAAVNETKTISDGRSETSKTFALDLNMNNYLTSDKVLHNFRILPEEGNHTRTLFNDMAAATENIVNVENERLCERGIKITEKVSNTSNSSRYDVNSILLNKVPVGEREVNSVLSGSNWINNVGECSAFLNGVTCPNVTNFFDSFSGCSPDNSNVMQGSDSFEDIVVPLDALHDSTSLTDENAYVVIESLSNDTVPPSYTLNEDVFQTAEPPINKDIIEDIDSLSNILVGDKIASADSLSKDIVPLAGTLNEDVSSAKTLNKNTDTALGFLCEDVHPLANTLNNIALVDSPSKDGIMLEDPLKEGILQHVDILGERIRPAVDTLIDNTTPDCSRVSMYSKCEIHEQGNEHIYQGSPIECNKCAYGSGNFNEINDISIAGEISHSVFSLDIVKDESQIQISQGAINDNIVRNGDTFLVLGCHDDRDTVEFIQSPSTSNSLYDLQIDEMKQSLNSTSANSNIPSATHKFQTTVIKEPTIAIPESKVEALGFNDNRCYHTLPPKRAADKLVRSRTFSSNELVTKFRIPKELNCMETLDGDIMMDNTTLLHFTNEFKSVKTSLLKLKRSLMESSCPSSLMKSPLKRTSSRDVAMAPPLSPRTCHCSPMAVVNPLVLPEGAVNSSARIQDFEMQTMELRQRLEEAIKQKEELEKETDAKKYTIDLLQAQLENYEKKEEDIFEQNVLLQEENKRLRKKLTTDNGCVEQNKSYMDDFNLDDLAHRKPIIERLYSHETSGEFS